VNTSCSLTKTDVECASQEAIISPWRGNVSSAIFIIIIKNKTMNNEPMKATEPAKKNTDVSMKTAEPAMKKDMQAHAAADNHKGIENHKTAAFHFDAAAKNHLDAVKHHQDGNLDKAAKCALEAQNHSELANVAQKADIKLHAVKH